MKLIDADDPASRSADLVAENIERLKELFPEAFTEGQIDFDVLKQLLGGAVDEREEKYGLNWHGKRRARQLALTPSIGTLLPCPEESVDWDMTQNLMIEGDNLEVLKLLQKSYAGKVKLIYIDPPYNTGKDFVYPDDYRDNIGNYLRLTGQIDGEGGKVTSNTEASGRFHTNWLNMMYPRLMLARNLLSPDGAICISIDDHEVHHLRSMCDDIFGSENQLAQFVWRTDGNFDNQAKVKSCHEYILMYARREELFSPPPVVDPAVRTDSKLYRDEIRNTIVKNGPRNPVSEVELPRGFPAERPDDTIAARSDAWPHYHSPAIIEGGQLKEPVKVSSGWSSKELLLEFIANNCRPVPDGKGQDTRFVISATGAIEGIKRRRPDQSHVVSVISGVGGAQKATAELEQLGVPFEDYPKPTALLRYLLRMNQGTSFTVLDFFAGSGAMGHAVLAQNAADGGTRRTILVQLPQPLDANIPQQKAAAAFCTKQGRPRVLTEVTKERLRRAAQHLRQEQPMASGDLGFRVLKLETSNIRTWAPQSADVPEAIRASVAHLQGSRTEADILFELLLKVGLELTVPVEERTIAGKSVHSVAAGTLMACLANEITNEEVEPLALGIVRWHKELAPAGETTLVFRDSAFADDVAKTNLTAILHQHGLENVRSL
jgi:adenine-specific DNA-methyltransferase